MDCERTTKPKVTLQCAAAARMDGADGADGADDMDCMAYRSPFWDFKLARAVALGRLVDPVRMFACIDDDSVRRMFIEACRLDDLRYVQRLVDFAGPERVRIDFGFTEACEMDALAVVRWLLAEQGAWVVRPLKWNFSDACAQGARRVATHLLETHGEQLRPSMSKIFAHVCKSQDLAVVKWFLSLSDAVDMHYDDDLAFRIACDTDGGDLAVAKWLVSLGGVNVHADDDDAFLALRMRRNKAGGRWLLSLDPTWPKWNDEDDDGLEYLRDWSATRDVWMRAVASVPRRGHRKGRTTPGPRSTALHRILSRR